MSHTTQSKSMLAKLCFTRKQGIKPPSLMARYFIYIYINNYIIINIYIIHILYVTLRNVHIYPYILSLGFEK